MIVAHQGGWDEILFALTPLVVVGGLLMLANRRANAARVATPEPAEEPEPPTTDESGL